MYSIVRRRLGRGPDSELLDKDGGLGTLVDAGDLGRLGVLFLVDELEGDVPRAVLFLLGGLLADPDKETVASVEHVGLLGLEELLVQWGRANEGGLELARRVRNLVQLDLVFLPE